MKRSIIIASLILLTTTSAYGGSSGKVINNEAKDKYVIEIEQSINELIKEKIEYEKSKSDPIGLKTIVTDSQEVIGNFYMFGRKRNIYSIPWWKYNLMKGKGFEDMKILHYHIINTLECGDENGNCDSGADSGPFQINQIHRGDYKKSMELMKAGKWIELYDYQLDWTENSMEEFKKRLCKKDTEDDTFKCMLRNHNGNVKNVGGGKQFRDVYSETGLDMKYIILDIIKNKKVEN